MENAVDALKIAFAVFVFVVAITITFSLISQARSTADYVLYYSDKTNFYNNLSSKEKNRIVSTTDVISTLYRCSKESISVTVDLKDESPKTFDLSNSTYSDTNSIEKDIGRYIKEKLKPEMEFEEEFVEAPISGIYDETGEDGTEIVLSAGSKKVYITYIEKIEES